MSPLKMFEYMVVGKPIIASDLPVLREVLEDGENAFLVPPADDAAWSNALQRLKQEPALAKQISDQARKDVMQYAWPNRVQRILDACKPQEQSRMLEGLNPTNWIGMDL